MSSVSGGLKTNTRAKLNWGRWDWSHLKRLYQIWGDLFISPPLTSARSCLFITCVLVSASLWQMHDCLCAKGKREIPCTLFIPIRLEKIDLMLICIHMYPLCFLCLDSKLTQRASSRNVCPRWHVCKNIFLKSRKISGIIFTCTGHRLHLIFNVKR